MVMGTRQNHALLEMTELVDELFRTPTFFHHNIATSRMMTAITTRATTTIMGTSLFERFAAYRNFRKLREGILLWMVLWEVKT
jgi:hypothetical protein